MRAAGARVRTLAIIHSTCTIQVEICISNGECSQLLTNNSCASAGTCVRASCTHTHTHTWTHTHTQTHTPTHIHIMPCTQARTHMQCVIYVMHASTPSNTSHPPPVQVQCDTHTHTQVCAHTHTHTCVHTPACTRAPHIRMRASLDA